MRILIYSINYAPEPTSTGKYAGELAAWLAKRGHEVEVIAPLPHYPQWRIYEDYRGKGNLGFNLEMLEGVKVLRTPIYCPDPAKVIGAGRRMLYELSFGVAASLYFLKRLFFEPRYDVVIPICPPVQLGAWPWLYGLIRRVPWVFHVQDLQVDAAVRLGMVDQSALTKLIYRIEAFLLKRASVVSTITEAMRRRIIERGVKDERTWLVPNWANLDVVTPGERDNAFRAALNVSDDAVVFMYAGNLGAKQGLEVLVDAADKLRDDRRLQFVIVGSGAAKASLEAQIAELKLDNLQLLPVQPLEKLSEMLAAADVHLVIQKGAAADLVMPSKLTNILAAGRPAIATAAPRTALADVLVDHDTGLICAPDDPAALAAAIKQIAEDPEARKRMGYNARRFADEHLHQNTILESFEAKLKELTGQ